jgi:uncharacterized membrane protein
MSPKSKTLITILLIVSAIGIADASYLTYEHYNQGIVPCSIGGCETVLTSDYATLGEIPISLFGIIFYALVFILGLLILKKGMLPTLINSIIGLATAAFLASLGLIYLQLFVIESICLYCMLSAGSSTTLFIVALLLRKEKKTLIN